MFGGYGAGLRGGRGVERIVGHAVDASRDAVAGEGDGLDGAGLEDRRVGPGEGQPVLDIGADLVAVEAAEVEPNDRLPDLELERVSCFCTREVGLGDFSG